MRLDSELGALGLGSLVSPLWYPEASWAKCPKAIFSDSLGESFTLPCSQEELRVSASLGSQTHSDLLAKVGATHFVTSLPFETGSHIPLTDFVLAL